VINKNLEDLDRNIVLENFYIIAEVANITNKIAAKNFIASLSYLFSNPVSNGADHMFKVVSEAYIRMKFSVPG